MKNCKIYLSDGQEITELPVFNGEISAPTDYLPPYSLSEMEAINLPFRPVLPERMTYEQYHNPIAFLIYCDDYKQAKPHRKGRINKKWAKRYGYILTREAAEQ